VLVKGPGEKGGSSDRPFFMLERVRASTSTKSARRKSAPNLFQLPSEKVDAAVIWIKPEMKYSSPLKVEFAELFG